MKFEKNMSITDPMLLQTLPRTAKVKGLAQLPYPCTNVFITFEYEKDQRKVLKKLTVGYTAAVRNDKSVLEHENYVFRNGREDAKVLYVSEPDEPNAIRWNDLNATFYSRSTAMALTTLVSFVSYIVVFYAVRAGKCQFNKHKFLPQSC